MTAVDQPDALGLAEKQLADVAALVETGPVDMGAFTQAEMAVVLGDVPALAGVEEAVLAEAVRSLAARGVLHRVPGEAAAEVVGDLGLVVALVATSVGTLDIRRGHEGPADAPWRWLISLFDMGVVGIDRIDALGLHRLSLYSVGGIAQAAAERMIDGKAKIPSGGGSASPDQRGRIATSGQGRACPLAADSSGAPPGDGHPACGRVEGDSNRGHDRRAVHAGTQGTRIPTRGR